MGNATRTAVKILKERLERLGLMHLGQGSHSTPDAGLCVMEAAAYVAGDRHTDYPSCVSPVIGAFMRAWNDSLPTDDERDRLLKPLIPEIIGTKNGEDSEDRRAWMATDWLVRTYAPAWLRLAGLTAQAEKLEALPELNSATTPPILPALEAVRADASAAWSAARSAAESAARSAAWSAARSAAESAARSAAEKHLSETVSKLQASAVELVKRMSSVAKSEVIAA